MRLFPFLLLFCTASITAHAQNKPGRQISESNYYQQENSNDIRMAGEYLRKYTLQFYIGTGVMVGGYLVAFASLPSPTSSGGTTGGSPGGITAGGLMILGGAVVQLLSHRHIGKAGQMLERSGLSQNLQLKGSTEGVGLALAFKF